MDKLKEILAKSKPKQKQTNNRDVIEEQKAKFQKQQAESNKLRKEEQAKRLKVIDEFYTSGRKLVKKNQPEPEMGVEEVKQKLRELYQPVTLFGETPYKRYERYLKAKKFHQEHPNEDMKMYDEDFLRKLKQNEEYDELDARFRPRLIEPKLLDDKNFRENKRKMILEQEEKSLPEMCDQIFLWIKKVLRTWSETLEQKYHEPQNQVIKRKFFIYQETSEDLKSLYHVLKNKKGDAGMIKSIYYIMNCCLIRQYIQANDRYIELSIGNAPWPMGEAMLGIKVRKNIQRLTYVLDNEMTRKWMQGIKRLMSVSQQLFPNEDRGKMAGYTVHSMI